MLPCGLQEQKVTRRVIPCDQGPCPCKKCQLKRACERCPFCKHERDSETEAANSQMQFLNVGVEIVGVIAMLMISLVYIWGDIISYSIYYGKKVYNSGRRNRLIAAGILGTIILVIVSTISVNQTRQYLKTHKCKDSSAPSIMYRLCTWRIFNRLNYCKNKIKSAKSSLSTMDKLCTWRIFCGRKFCTNRIKRDPSLMDKISKWKILKKFNKCMKKTKKPVPKIKKPLTDAEAKEMFRKARIYAIPTEFKQPPAVLTYLYNMWSGEQIELGSNLPN